MTIIKALTRPAFLLAILMISLTPQKAQAGLWDDFTSAISGVVNSVKNKISGAVNSVKRSVNSVVSKVKRSVNNVVSKVKNTVRRVKEQVKGYVDKGKRWVSGIKDKVKGYIQKGKDKLKGWVDKGKRWVSGIKDKVKGYIQKGKDWLKNKVNQARSYAGRLLTKAKAFKDRVVRSLKSKYEYLKQQASRAINKGKNYLRSISQKIIQLKNKLKERVKSLAARVINAGRQLKQKVAQVLEKAKQIPAAVASKIREGVSRLAELANRYKAGLARAGSYYGRMAVNSLQRFQNTLKRAADYGLRSGSNVLRQIAYATKRVENAVQKIGEEKVVALNTQAVKEAQGLQQTANAEPPEASVPESTPPGAGPESSGPAVASPETTPQPSSGGGALERVIAPPVEKQAPPQEPALTLPELEQSKLASLPNNMQQNFLKRWKQLGEIFQKYSPYFSKLSPRDARFINQTLGKWKEQILPGLTQALNDGGSALKTHYRKFYSWFMTFSRQISAKRYRLEGMIRGQLKKELNFKDRLARIAVSWPVVEKAFALPFNPQNRGQVGTYNYLVKRFNKIINRRDRLSGNRLDYALKAAGIFAKAKMLMMATEKLGPRFDKVKSYLYGLAKSMARNGTARMYRAGVY